MVKVSLVQLEYIVALDTHRHFARAAESCHVTQPTLSMQINKLEKLLGVIIFDRSRQPIMVTDVGEKIIAQARITLNEARRIEELIDDERQEIRGELTLGVIPTVAPYLLPLFLNSFLDRYPLVKVKVKELLTEDILAALHQDSIDVGILVTPFAHNPFHTVPLFYEPFKIYGSDLSKDGSPMPLEDLKDHPLWLLEEGHCFRDQVLQLCHEQQDGLLQYESGSLEALKRIVNKQGGVTLLPELAALDLRPAEKEMLRAFQDPVPSREVSLIMKRSYLKKKLVEALREEIIKNLPDTIRQASVKGMQVIAVNG